MTADELKNAYETAQAVTADKAQEAEIFKRAHEARVKKEELAKLVVEKKEAPVEKKEVPVEKKDSLAQESS